MNSLGLFVSRIPYFIFIFSSKRVLLTKVFCIFAIDYETAIYRFSLFMLFVSRL